MDGTTDAPFVTQIVISRPAEAVFAALTEKALVDRYYLAPLGEDVGQIGSPIWYGTGDARMIEGEVRALDPPLAFTHSFAFSGVGATASTPSEVTYALEEEAGATTLTVTHAGFAPDSQAFADVAMGWPIILGGLKAMLEE